MFSAKLVCIVTAVCLSASINLGCAWENSGSDPMPTPPAICQYPCHPLSPPASGDPSYGVALPPPPPPVIPGYSADVLPPPPPQLQQPGQGNCPPAPIQCCPYYTPLPPNGVYVPHNHALPCSLPNFLYVIMMLLFTSSVTF